MIIGSRLDWKSSVVLKPLRVRVPPLPPLLVMKKQKKLTIAEEITNTEQYIAFLRKRLDSKNYKANVTEEEYEQTKMKYDKAKFRLRIMKGK